MVTLEPATEDEYEGFLELTRQETAAYLEATMRLMKATWEEYGRWFRTVGQVFTIRDGGDVAGFCWIEERGRVLHLHGLVLGKEHRGRGIGGRVLEMLEARSAGRVDAIELGVHVSNKDAIRLYERTGFRTVKTLDDLGFLIMQKRMAGRGNL